MTDLTALEALVAGATKGPWYEGPATYHLADTYGRVLATFENERENYDADLALVVALVNSAGPMIAELKALRAEVERLRKIEAAARRVMDDVDDDGVAEAMDVAVHALRAALAAPEPGR